jgi:hypothetical protein
MAGWPLPCPLDHPGDAHAVEWLATLIHKHVSRPSLLLTLQALEPDKLIALKVVRTINAALESADLNGAFGKVQIIAPQVTGLAHPEAMAI